MNYKFSRYLAQIKASQKAWEYRKYGRPIATPTPLKFEDWFLDQFRHFESKGAEFELLPDKTVKIVWVNKPTVIRTVESFKEEYQTEYLSKFKK